MTWELRECPGMDSAKLRDGPSGRTQTGGLFAPGSGRCVGVDDILELALVLSVRSGGSILPRPLTRVRWGRDGGPPLVEASEWNLAAELGEVSPTRRAAFDPRYQLSPPSSCDGHSPSRMPKRCWPHTVSPEPTTGAS